MTIFADGFGLYSNIFCRPLKKRILLLRHAQTAGKQAGQRDYARELTAEGEQQIRKTGSFFIHASINPDYILSSSAVRARSTAKLINERLSLPTSRISFLDELYEAAPGAWISQLRTLPEEIRIALFVGHNPAISLVATTFAKRLIDLTPGAFAYFESDASSWDEFGSSVHEINIS